MTGVGRPRSEPKKRANGTASKPRKKGDRYEVAISLGGGKRKYVYGATDLEASAAAAAVIRDLKRYDLTAPDVTVGALAERWLRDYRKSGVEGSTFGRREERIVKHIIGDDRINHFPAAALRKEHVERWLEAHVAEGYWAGSKHKQYTPTGLKQFKSDLVRILDYGIGEDVPGLSRNLAKAARLPIAEAEKTLKRSLTAEQVTRLVLELTETTRRYAAFMLIGLYTGARPGEIHALSWSDIDWDAHVLRFHRALKRDTGGRPTEIGKLKTAGRGGAQEREVRVPVIVMHALKRERDLQDEMRRDWWPEKWDGLVFRGTQGGPPWAGNMLRDLRRIMVDAGIDEIDDLDVYELRHTCATILDRSGVPLTQIIDQLGWKDDRPFWGNYRHRGTGVQGDSAVAVWEGL